MSKYKHTDTNCQVPFCKVCLQQIKDIQNILKPNLGTNPGSEIAYGVDSGSPEGDETSLSIIKDKEIFIFNGKEAEVILALKHQWQLEAMDTMIHLVEVHIDHNPHDVMMSLMKAQRSLHLSGSRHFQEQTASGL